jgi:hypothetical protein
MHAHYARTAPTLHAPTSHWHARHAGGTAKNLCPKDRYETPPAELNTSQPFTGVELIVSGLPLHSFSATSEHLKAILLKLQQEGSPDSPCPNHIGSIFFQRNVEVNANLITIQKIFASHAARRAVLCIHGQKHFRFMMEF